MSWLFRIIRLSSEQGGGGAAGWQGNLCDAEPAPAKAHNHYPTFCSSPDVSQPVGTACVHQRQSPLSHRAFEDLAGPRQGGQGALCGVLRAQQVLGVGHAGEHPRPHRLNPPLRCQELEGGMARGTAGRVDGGVAWMSWEHVSGPQPPNPRLGNAPGPRGGGAADQQSLKAKIWSLGGCLVPIPCFQVSISTAHGSVSISCVRRCYFMWQKGLHGRGAGSAPRNRGGGRNRGAKCAKCPNDRWRPLHRGGSVDAGLATPIQKENHVYLPPHVRHKMTSIMWRSGDVSIRLRRIRWGQTNSWRDASHRTPPEGRFAMTPSWIAC